MALALYRRYRPDTFGGVIGQDQVTVPLMRALDEGKLTHAYLFSGPRGCGKTSSARILARCMNCAQGPTSTPCGECESCRDLATGGPGSIDVVEIDAASHNGVDDARELRERAGFAPARDRYKIFILDEAHMVTPQGFNALLKIVEEPPEHVMFIFATTEPDKVIGTIRSRTHHYPFRLVPAEVMGPYLEDICAKEDISPEPGVLKLAMRAGGGSMRDTLSVLDQLMVGAVDGVVTLESSVALLGFTPETMIGEAVDAVVDNDGERLYGVVQKVVVGGFDPRRFVEDLLARVRDLLVLTLAGERAETVLSDTAEGEDVEALRRQASALGLGALAAMAEIINDTLGSMSGSVSPRMRLELLAAKLLAGRERGFAAPAAAATDSPSGAPAFTGTVTDGASSMTVAAPSAARGGFAGASRNRAGAVASASAAGRGGFIGSSRPTASAVSMDTGTSSDSSCGASSLSAVNIADWPSAEPARTSSAKTPTPVSAGRPAAVSSTSARNEASAPADTRTPDERWDSLVASLPEDVRRYVGRDRVLRISLRPYKQTGRMRLWLKFDKPLNKYAFALAVASEPVDGVTKVVDILRAAVRGAFGEQTDMAPTPTTDDGHTTPPFSKLPPDEQRRIKSQLLKENLQAASAATQTGPQTSRERSDEGRASADAAASGSSDDDAHRKSSADAAASAEGTSGSVSGMRAVWDAEDPWAVPMPKPSHAAADSAAASDGAKEPPESIVRTHAAVPDLSDDSDPWAQPAPIPTSVRTSAEPSARHAPNNGAGGTASAAPTPTGPVASDAISEDDPWNPKPARNAMASTGQRPGLASATQAVPSSIQNDDPWKDVPPPAEPDDPWNTPAPTRLVPEATAHHQSPQSAAPNTDPWTMPGRNAAAAYPAVAGTPVDADKDEYSMDDASLGTVMAISRDELRAMFDVKQVETFEPDDPRNPRNMRAVAKHDD